MKCPVCVQSDLLMSERSGIEIDYCPKCRGVWLDRGELDKIIQNSQPSTFTQNQRGNELSYGYGSNSYSKPKKKESFLSELFDF